MQPYNYNPNFLTNIPLLIEEKEEKLRLIDEGELVAKRFREKGDLVFAAQIEQQLELLRSRLHELTLIIFGPAPKD